MELKFRSKSFTLVETIVVLAVISIIGFLLVAKPLQSETSKVSSLERQFEAFYARMKSRAIGSDNGLQIIFSGHQVTADNRIMEINEDLHFENKTIEIKNDGYVHPTTVHVYNSNNQTVAKIIYSLGFGNFRFEKE